MSLPVWPSSLPSAPLVGTQTFEALGTRPIETEFQYGNIEMRARSPLRVAPMSLSLHLSTAQFSVFRNFIEITLSAATQRFTYYFDDFEGRRLARTCLFRGGLAGISAQKRGAAFVEVRLQLMVFF